MHFKRVLRDEFKGFLAEHRGALKPRIAPFARPPVIEFRDASGLVRARHHTAAATLEGKDWYEIEMASTRARTWHTHDSAQPVSTYMLQRAPDIWPEMTGEREKAQT